MRALLLLFIFCLVLSNVASAAMVCGMDMSKSQSEHVASIKKQWVEPFGDMRQELVFIGQGLDKEHIIQALDECLLSEEEILRGRDYWTALQDPFPAWEQTV